MEACILVTFVQNEDYCTVFSITFPRTPTPQADLFLQDHFTGQTVLPKHLLDLSQLYHFKSTLWLTPQRCLRELLQFDRLPYPCGTCCMAF